MVGVHLDRSWGHLVAAGWRLVRTVSVEAALTVRPDLADRTTAPLSCGLRSSSRTPRDDGQTIAYACCCCGCSCHMNFTVERSPNEQDRAASVTRLPNSGPTAARHICVMTSIYRVVRRGWSAYWDSFIGQGKRLSDASR